MNEFEYHRPSSLGEALDLLKRHGDDARLIAGGTALILFMKQRLAQPAHLVSLAGISGLDYIREEDSQLRIGALCTHTDVETSALVQERAPLVSETFRRVGTPRIRNMATVGGALVHGDPNQDPPPSLIALGASVVLRSDGQERTAPLDGFFVDYYETAIEPGEVLTELRVPLPSANTGCAYVKFLPRTADDYATVSVAAVVQVGANDMCEEVRVVIGSAGTTPVRSTSTEAALKGQRLSEQSLRSAVAGVPDEVSPLDDFRGSADYKRDMAQVFARRALEQAWANAPGAR